MDHIVERKLIKSFPGYNGKMPSNMYSGYMNVDRNKYNYYIFVECEQNPKKCPLVFWTNGGPACSGLLGFFEEMGPFRPVSSSKLKYNPNTWTKYANIVFMEQPAGTGFSIAKTKNANKSNDKIAAKDNLSFIIEFLDTYPEYKNHDIYLASESYGGHYIPMWTDEILKYNNKVNKDLKINLKGYLIGNPYVNYTTGWDDQVQTYWGHQKISQHLWDRYKKRGCPNASKKNWIKKGCQELAYTLTDSVGKINPYAMDYPLCLKDQQNRLITIVSKKNKTKKASYNPCVDKYTKKFLRKKSVQKKLHVKTKKVKWNSCSNTVNYSMKDQWFSTVGIIDSHMGNVTPKDFRILIMSGTDDSICGTIGTQKWINDLKNINLTDDDWKQYFVDNQPSGYIQKHIGKGDRKFELVTVNFAGHEIPEYRPRQALHIFKKWISNKL